MYRNRHGHRDNRLIDFRQFRILARCQGICRTLDLKEIDPRKMDHKDRSCFYRSSTAESFHQDCNDCRSAFPHPRILDMPINKHNVGIPDGGFRHLPPLRMLRNFRERKNDSLHAKIDSPLEDELSARKDY